MQVESVDALPAVLNIAMSAADDGDLDVLLGKYAEHGHSFICSHGDQLSRN